MPMLEARRPGAVSSADERKQWASNGPTATAEFGAPNLVYRSESDIRGSQQQRRTHSRNFDNRLNFDRDIEGQRTHSNGAACVPPTVAEYLDKKV